jgi:Ulp1 protease family, C-terminal catalytic domain
MECSLNSAVDQLIGDISTKVLGKRKFDEFDDDDSVAVDGGVELPCNIFNMLRHGEWFDAWLLMAGMQMSDKPSFVKYGYSVPLDQMERFGRNGTRRASRPLAGWKKTIEKFRSQGRTQHGQGVYFCPLNTNNNHFALLEINEREEKIYHYDSMASEDIINGKVEISRVGKLVQVS